MSLHRSWRATPLVLLMAAQAAFAYAVYGKIGEKYAALGGAGGVLGAARNDESPAPFGGRFNQFANGYIYFHPETGAFAVWGAIGAKWNELGRTTYGYPITDESVTPDRRGRFNHFRALQANGKPEASIYWTPQTGAHAVYGDIRKAWATQGWERGRLGYPISDEFQEGDARRTNFENGYIRWTANGGAKIHYYGELLQSPPNTFGGITVHGLRVAREGQHLGGNDWFLGEPALCGAWQQQVRQLNEPLKQLLRSQVNPRMPGGFSIRSDARMRLTTTCSARTEILQACGNQVTVRAKFPRNLFLFHVTTPTVLGSWADPEFSVDFDIEARTVIDLPSNAKDSIRIGPTTFLVSGVKFDSQNASGDVLKAANTLVHFVGGPDMTSSLTRDRSFVQQPLIAPPLNAVVPLLNSVPATWRMENCVDGSVVVLNATSRPPAPPPVVR